MPAPWTPSLARMRCQYFQPFWPRVMFVADGDTLGIGASSRIGSTCFDSPENAGPTSPTILSVLIACWARAVAWSGLPWLSYLINWILVVGLVALYSSTAIVAPLNGGITMPAFSPPRSPMNPSLTVDGCSPPPVVAPPPPPPLSLPPQAESRRVDAAAMAASPWIVRRTETSVADYV